MNPQEKNLHPHRLQVVLLQRLSLVSNHTNLVSKNVRLKRDDQKQHHQNLIHLLTSMDQGVAVKKVLHLIDLHHLLVVVKLLLKPNQQGPQQISHNLVHIQKQMSLCL
uniref:Uncharacterized protein n=1 Tax=Cacopsylla melanoneura TaxID=428564 RepID=A0A8D8M1U7_9HEMI